MSEPYYSQRACSVCVSPSAFFIHSFIQLLLFNSPQIMIVSKDLKLKSNSSIHTGGREGEGVGEEREGDVRFFP